MGTSVCRQDNFVVAALGVASNLGFPCMLVWKTEHAYSNRSQALSDKS